MAKKSVASLQTGSKRLTKAIKMVKKEGSDSYSFVEKIIDPKFAKDWLSGKPIISKITAKKPSTINTEKIQHAEDKIVEKKPQIIQDSQIAEESQIKEGSTISGEKSVEEKPAEEQK
tara:strand:+ start:2704 stop:3054 length:351 start_codon:yes stop_codon:yes gene_type:complete